MKTQHEQVMEALHACSVEAVEVRKAAAEALAFQLLTTLITPEGAAKLARMLKP